MKNNQINVPQAKQAMEQFKMQAAQEVGVNLTNGPYPDSAIHSSNYYIIKNQVLRKMIVLSTF